MANWVLHTCSIDLSPNTWSVFMKCWQWSPDVECLNPNPASIYNLLGCSGVIDYSSSHKGRDWVLRYSSRGWILGWSIHDYSASHLASGWAATWSPGCYRTLVTSLMTSQGGSRDQERAKVKGRAKSRRWGPEGVSGAGVLQYYQSTRHKPPC